MSATMTVFKWFSISQYNEEAAYLSEMHQNGWSLIRVRWPGLYTFERCTPEKMVYQLDYNKDGAAHSEEYRRMFADCGWEYLFDFVGFSYFRKPESEMAGAEEIFCDDESRLDMLRRIIKGRMLPLLALFFCIVIPQLTINLLRSYDDPVYRIMSIIYIIIFLIYLSVFGWLGIEYIKMARRLGK